MAICASPTLLISLLLLIVSPVLVQSSASQVVVRTTSLLDLYRPDWSCLEYCVELRRTGGANHCAGSEPRCREVCDKCRASCRAVQGGYSLDCEDIESGRLEPGFDQQQDEQEQRELAVTRTRRQPTREWNRNLSSSRTHDRAHGPPPGYLTTPSSVDLQAFYNLSRSCKDLCTDPRVARVKGYLTCDLNKPGCEKVCLLCRGFCQINNKTQLRVIDCRNASKLPTYVWDSPEGSGYYLNEKYPTSPRTPRQPTPDPYALPPGYGDNMNARSSAFPPYRPRATTQSRPPQHSNPQTRPGNVTGQPTAFPTGYIGGRSSTPPSKRLPSGYDIYYSGQNHSGHRAWDGVPIPPGYDVYWSDYGKIPPPNARPRATMLPGGNRGSGGSPRPGKPLDNFRKNQSRNATQQYGGGGKNWSSPLPSSYDAYYNDFGPPPPYDKRYGDNTTGVDSYNSSWTTPSTKRLPPGYELYYTGIHNDKFRDWNGVHIPPGYGVYFSDGGKYPPPDRYDEYFKKGVGEGRTPAPIPKHRRNGTQQLGGGKNASNPSHIELPEGYDIYYTGKNSSAFVFHGVTVPAGYDVFHAGAGTTRSPKRLPPGYELYYTGIYDDKFRDWNGVHIPPGYGVYFSDGGKYPPPSNEKQTTTPPPPSFTFLLDVYEPSKPCKQMCDELSAKNGVNACVPTMAGCQEVCRKCGCVNIHGVSTLDCPNIR